MKKITFIAFMLMSLVGFAQNYVSDPTFVNPSSGTWIVVGSGAETGHDSTDTHTADGTGCYIVGPEFNSEIKQNISAGNTPAGTGTYTVKYWVKGTTGTQVVFSAYNGGNVLGTQYTIQNDDTWELVQELFTFNTDSGVTFKLIKKGGNFLSVKFDDVSLEEGDTLLSTKSYEKDLFSVFPTVTSDYINIQPKTGVQIDKLEVYSVIGKKVKTINLSNNVTQVNVNDLSNGVYLLKAYSENNESSVTRFVKK